MVTRTYEVRTYGCQMNVHDSERIAGLLDEAATPRSRTARAVEEVGKAAGAVKWFVMDHARPPARCGLSREK
jgi:hypothetical protein